jgi:uncharacterized protein (UPF0128 family)
VHLPRNSKDGLEPNAFLSNETGFGRFGFGAFTDFRNGFDVFRFKTSLIGVNDESLLFEFEF